jgi:hypothetical protein
MSLLKGVQKQYKMVVTYSPGTNRLQEGTIHELAGRKAEWFGVMIVVNQTNAVSPAHCLLYLYLHGWPFCTNIHFASCRFIHYRLLYKNHIGSQVKNQLIKVTTF